MSHVVIECRCREDRERDPLLPTCQVPGHGLVPSDPVDPQALVDAAREMTEHLNAAAGAMLRARAAWVSRGLPAEGFASSWARWCDAKAMEIDGQRHAILRWAAAAQVVADRRKEPADA